MFFPMRDAVIAALGIFLAIFTGFVITANRAAAPDKTPPARIEVPQATSTTPTTSETQATTTAAKPAEKPKPVPKTEPEAPPVSTPAVSLPLITQSVASSSTPAPMAPPSLNDTVRASIVNILCLAQGGSVHSISASGVIIDPRGVILTNSHVAQYFLLRNYQSPDSVQCVVRSGSPATAKYTAELLFVSPSWIRENAQKIDETAPTGNGEHDYALLRITGPASPNVSLPASFPSIPLSTDAPDTGQSMLVAAYPAGFLGTLAIQQNLYETSSLATVGTLYTFETSTPDLFSVGGTVVSQQGSSGGAAANQDGQLEGLIVTSTDAPDTASRDLRALAVPYIKRDFEKESGVSFDTYLSGDLASEAHQFQTGIAPTLTAELVNVLQGTAVH